MRLLFVSRFMPHARFRGSGAQDLYRAIVWLSQRHEVSLIGFVTPESESAVPSMRAICREVVAVPYQRHSLVPRLLRLLGRILLPRTYGRNIAWSYYYRLRRLTSQRRFDVVIFDGAMAFYGPTVRRMVRVVDEVDVYADVAWHIYVNEPQLFRRALYWFDWRRTQLVERAILRYFDGITARSEADRLTIAQQVPDKRLLVFEPWFEGLEELFDLAPERPPGNDLLFMGAMGHPKNIEAAQFFVEKVLPLVREQVPDACLYIVGAAPAREIQALHSQPHVVVTGEVAELAPYYRRCAVNVVPLLAGGGVIVKTLNGMAAGRPTISTSLGASGTGAQAGRDLLVVPPQPQAFAAAVVRLLQDDGTWHMLARNGKSFVQAHFDWSENMERLEGFLSGLCQAGETDREQARAR